MHSLSQGGEDLFDNQASKLRYQAYARLQSTAVAFGESLPIPEIVAIGGQSDGKSSLMEALLGFRFNICSSEMGTRRPLIVQMVHDPSALEPRCRLQDEDGNDYGEVLPEGTIAEAIRDRTETHLRRRNAPVSSKPIVMRAEYSFCPNLTIIDTPGFILKARQGEAETTPEDILAMVKEQCAPRHRLILFLQQSSVEWCSSLWMHVIQEVDPTFSRTVMVASKFDNRLKEFSERWELEKYISASGYLPPIVKPFFVALPKDRSHASSSEWRRAIQEVDSRIKGHLRTAIEGGFDEERWGGRIGFGNLKRFLEEELATRYRDAAPSTLALLKERCAAVTAEMAAAQERLSRATDVGALRRAAIQHTLELAGRMECVMSGFGGADPKQHGMTTEEERNQAGAPWPEAMIADGSSAAVAFAAAAKFNGSEALAPAHAGLRLFGGAAFERALQEFGRVVEALPLPPISRDQVVNMLLAQRSRGNGAGAVARTAEELARDAAGQALGPLLDVACARLGFVLRKAYDTALEMEALVSGGAPSSGPDSCAEVLRPYLAFHSTLRTSFNEVVGQLEARAKELLHHHLTFATSHFSATEVLDSIAEGGVGAGNNEGWSRKFALEEEVHQQENMAPPPATGVQQQLLQRPGLVSAQMTVPETPSPEIVPAERADGAASGRRGATGLHPLSVAGRNIDVLSPAKGRVAKAARLAHGGGGGGGRSRLAAADESAVAGYLDVCAAAEQLFRCVKESVAAQGPVLKAAFLEPLQARLASELCMQMVGKKDSEFMASFATAGALATLEAERDAVRRRAQGLSRMTEEFEELARAL